MMTQQLGFSILSAPLAAIDRRELSQAWYSALHLAQKSTVPQERAIAAKPPLCQAKATRSGRAERGALRPPGPRVVARGRQTPVGIHGPVPDRRSPRSDLARKMERCFLDPARKAERATFTLDGSNARVHLSVRTNADGVRLVAVCMPAVRAQVMRALEQARYALALRGVALHAELRGETV